MGNVIRLHGDPHEEVLHLLPWYGNGTLDADEEALVEEHLLTCEECRQELAQDRVMALHVAGLPTPAKPDFAKLRARAEASPAPVRAAAPAILRRRVSIGWAVLAQAAAIVLMIGAVGLWSRPATGPYHALGAAPTTASGNALVMFRPDTTEAAMRAALRGSAARLVGGPTEGNAYVLRVAPGSRNGALARLRADAHVMMAEPIDGDAAR